MSMEPWAAVKKGFRLECRCHQLLSGFLAKGHFPPVSRESLYRSPNMFRVIKSRRLRWGGHVARMEEGRSAFKILTGKPIGKRPLGRPRSR